MMTIMPAEREWTLSEAARVLREPQHRLIYLCEKGAVVPDLGEARGRGSSRRFSKRNLLEFSVALRLRSLSLPVDTVKAILHTLRSFEATVRKKVTGFDLVTDLRQPTAPELHVVVGEGPRIYFSLSERGQATRVFGGILLSPRSTRPNRIPEIEFPTTGLEGAARVEINLTATAKALPTDL
jgi:DNA-binding transcriptional MerR regulator